MQGEQDALGRAVVPLIDKGEKPALESGQILVGIGAGKGEALAARRAGGALRDLVKPWTRKRLWSASAMSSHMFAARVRMATPDDQPSLVLCAP